MKTQHLLVSFIALALTAQPSAVNAQNSSSKSGTEQRNYGIYNFQGEMNVNTIEDGKRISFKMIDNKVMSLSVDGNLIAEADYPKYEQMIKRILVQAEKDRKQAELDRRQADKDRQQAEKDRLQADRDRQQADRDRQKAELDREESDKSRKQAEQDRAQADKDRKQADKDRDQAELDRTHADKGRAQADKDRKQAEIERAHADKDRLQADKDRKQAEIDRANADKDRVQADKDRRQAEIDRARAEQDRKLLDEMLTELVKLKVVTDKDEIRTLLLNHDELIVNGAKQSAEKHDTFENKYLKQGKGSINYQHSDSFRNFSIQ